MLKRLRSWSRLNLAVLAMFTGVILFGLIVPCSAAPMAGMQPMPPARTHLEHKGQPCCGDVPAPAPMACPVGCTTLAPSVEPPIPSPHLATTIHWNTPAATLHGLAAAPDDPPPR